MLCVRFAIKDQMKIKINNYIYLEKKTMKKALVIFMVCLFTFSLVACGKDKDGKKDPKDSTQETSAPADSIEEVAKTYNLDLKSTEQQKMSDERTTKEQLAKIVHEYFKDVTFLDGTEMANVTYADIKAQLGVDASIYYFEDALVTKQCFIWQASDSDNAKFLATFSEGKLYAIGSSNVG